MNARTCLVGALALTLAGVANPGCSCGDTENTAQTTGCGSDCNQPCNDAIPLGLIGAYTSVAAAKDGAIWVSGYNDAPVSKSLQAGTLYGDLVVGKYDSGKQRVQWQTVDGVPALAEGSCPDNDPKGWRGGSTDPGNDVGLWTSLQLDANDRPMVAYYDATNGSAKFATYDGAQWASYVLSSKPSADIGRYAKLLVVDGKPVVAFLAMEAGKDGYTRSRVVVGRANANPPTSASAWTFEDAAVDEQTPCLPDFCSGAQVCVPTGTLAPGQAGQCLAAVAGCTPADCGTGKACVTVKNKATCVAVVDKTAPRSYPNAAGDYVSLASGPSGLGLVVYDRTRGNLIGVSNAGGKWTASILDGQTGASNAQHTNTGDVGIAAALAITPNGDWHVVYVNGIQEQLQYMLVPGGDAAKHAAPEVVDNGSDNGKPYSDGVHVVGDDAAIMVDATGNVQVAYQDSTAGTLKLASGAAQGATHKWTTRTIPQQRGFAGYFPRFVPSTSQITNFYRQTDHAAGEVTGDVAFVTP